jgi:hypothetical protein
MRAKAYPRYLPTGRVIAALEFLEWSRMSTTVFGEPFPEKNQRELTTQELRVKDAALSTLLEYFNSEDASEPPCPPPGDSAAPDPNAPVTMPHS